MSSQARGIRMTIAGMPGRVRDILARGWEGAASAEGLFEPSLAAAVRSLTA